MKNHIKKNKNKYAYALIIITILFFFKKDKIECAFFNSKKILFVTIPLFITGTGAAIYFYLKKQTQPQIQKKENQLQIQIPNKKQNIKIIDITKIIGKENKIPTEEMLSLFCKSDHIIESPKQKINSPTIKSEYFLFQDQHQQTNNQNKSIELDLSGLKKLNNIFEDQSLNKSSSESSDNSILEIIKELKITKGIIFKKTDDSGNTKVYLASRED
jgi:hypothetical protein